MGNIHAHRRGSDALSFQGLTEFTQSRSWTKKRKGEAAAPEVSQPVRRELVITMSPEQHAIFVLTQVELSMEAGRPLGVEETLVKITQDYLDKHADDHCEVKKGA